RKRKEKTARHIDEQSFCRKARRIFYRHKSDRTTQRASQKSADPRKQNIAKHENNIGDFRPNVKEKA
ncbi:MAG: hypothetical protein K2J50_03320, partial [Treponemataceae bacterium]|nr:hypothetical protein [Treponemataceae bacterium]